MDRRTDGGDYNIPFAFLKKRGDINNNKINNVIQKIKLNFTDLVNLGPIIVDKKQIMKIK